MGTTNLKTLARQIEDHLFDHLIPFWCGPAVDHEQGGWMGWLSNDLKADRTQPKGLIVNSRILWAFSAVYQKRPDGLFKQMADRAFDYIINRFWDANRGGAFWRLDDTGHVVLDDSKKTYGQAFYIYALAEYFRASGESAALARAKELFELIERHTHDDRFGGYIEVRRRDWSEADSDARLSDKDMNEKKSMNNHLHVLEAYTNLYRVWKEPRIAQRLCELIGLFEQRILDHRTMHLNHFFDEEWRVRSDSYTFGHDIEATWLLCEAAEILEDAALLKRAGTVAIAMAEIVLKEGIDTDGALRYEGRGGRVVDAGKECWPQAEAVIGFLNAYQISHDEKYLKSVFRAWDFIDSHLVDRIHGDWFWRITPEGHVDATLPKVNEWKGPYHASRMCLETIRRLRAIQG